MASKDDNGYPILYGVSHLDGVTPVAVKFNSSRGMAIDSTTSISFSPSVSASQTVNGYSIAKATSSSDDSTVLPWVVNASTGAVLVDM
jgi:hypothetical protein